MFLDFPNQLITNSAFLVALSVWTIFWKGLALWKASRNNQLYWFVALLVLNTVGILEIIYIRFFQEKRTDKREWPFELPRIFRG